MPDQTIKKDFKKELFALQQSYLKKLRAHASEIRRSYELFSSGMLALKDLQNLYRLSHNFSGSGTTFGFPEISRTANDLHQTLKYFLEKDNPAQSSISQEREAVLEAMKRFEQVCRDALAQDISEKENEASPFVQENIATAKIIGILGHKSDATKGLIKQLKGYGYHPLYVKDASELVRSMDTTKYHAFILFNTLSVNEKQEFEIVFSNRDKQRSPTPLIIVSLKDDFQSRLSSVKIGATGFFDEKVDVLEVIDKIEDLATQSIEDKHYNVLIVDDDDMLTEFYSYTLKHAGNMNPIKLSASKDIFKTLEQQSIDLILVDIDVPLCSGEEMVSIIRQNNTYRNIPILFICPQDNIEELNANRNLGLEQFLVKPFTPEKLLTSAKRVIKQAEIIRKKFETDSLTAVLNYQVFFDKLHALVPEMRIQQKEMMLVSMELSSKDRDIQTKNYLLKSMGRLLQQYVPSNSLVGRYSDNKFFLLIEGNMQETKELFERIQTSFSELHDMLPVLLTNSVLVHSNNILEVLEEFKK